MNRQWLERTLWAKKFKQDAPTSYELAIQYALSPGFAVAIRETYETGERVFAIVAIVDGEETGFWMDACKMRRHAENMCILMGWEIKD